MSLFQQKQSQARQGMNALAEKNGQFGETLWRVKGRRSQLIRKS